MYFMDVIGLLGYCIEDSALICVAVVGGTHNYNWHDNGIFWPRFYAGAEFVFMKQWDWFLRFLFHVIDMFEFSGLCAWLWDVDFWGVFWCIISTDKMKNKMEQRWQHLLQPNKLFRFE